VTQVIAADYSGRAMPDPVTDGLLPAAIHSV